MAPSTYTRIYLQERPKKDITSTTFNSEKLPFSSLTEKLGNGQSLVQVTWLSLDPAMRGYLNDARSYLPPVKIGEVRSN
jgi:NADPH-dependent curcumin reductase CurA